MTTTNLELFLDNFKELTDPRSSRNQLHSISEILLVTLAAIICGAEGWQDVEDYGNIKLDHLRKYLPYKNGIPSDDTIRRFFRAVDPQRFQELFRKWVNSLGKTIDTSVIAIDGKSARHSYDEDKNMLHTISAYATEARLVLGQQKVSDKSNEITAIPELLDWLNLKGSVVTIDAMGCQHKIGKKIVHKEGNYIFALKENQKSLLNKVESYFNAKNLKNLDEGNYFKQCDKGHGRIEIRECWVSSDVDFIRTLNPEWNTIQSIIRIDSQRQFKDEATLDRRYYVTSLSTKAVDAKDILTKIRSHWRIENSLHWVLDMSFGEDQSRIRKDNAPQVMAVMRHMALNLLQQVKSTMKRMSIRRLRKMCGWENSILDSVILQIFS